MTSLNCSCARQALLDRRVNINSKELLTEFKHGRWCLELVEIDNSAANGYAGLEIHQLVNELDIAPKQYAREALLAECEQLIPGYQLGSGFPHWMSVSLGLIKIETISNLYSLDDTDLTLWGIDLFQGLAGTLLTLALFKTYTSLHEFEIFSNAVCEELLGRLAPTSSRGVGFAHGDLGIAYSLLAAKRTDTKVREYIETVLMEAESSLISSGNFAVCKGGVSILVIAAMAGKAFGNDSFPIKRYRDLARFIAQHIIALGDASPAHQCCGTSGVIETLVSYAEAAGDEEIIEISRKAAHLCITSKSVGRINETGMLFGIAGIDYVISKVKEQQPHQYSMLYPLI